MALPTWPKSRTRNQYYLALLQDFDGKFETVYLWDDLREKVESALWWLILKKTWHFIQVITH